MREDISENQSNNQRENGEEYHGPYLIRNVCHKCGWFQKGMFIPEVCPECGEEVKASVGRYQYKHL